MDYSAFTEEAHRLFLTDYSSELNRNGILQPTKNRDPIFPPWLGIEYESMEMDRAKYFLYYTSIHLCLKSWDPKNILNILVVGAGRGRLVDFCNECLNEFNISGTVHVLEVNTCANNLLKQKFDGDSKVVIHEPIAIRTVKEIESAISSNHCDSKLTNLAKTKCVDLFVSELFGSFGDNEFVAEILSASVKLFGKHSESGLPLCTSIPESYTTYICAIHSKTLGKYFKENPSEQLHVLGLPRDTTFLTQIADVYTASCTSRLDNTKHNVIFHRKSGTEDITWTGLAGYFRAKLYGELYIDTRPTAKQNTYFWESAFFPLTNDFTPSCQTVTVSISRICKKVKSKQILDVKYPQLKMWYEWTCPEGTSTHNANGKHHILYL
uniref:Protein arginine N-methyltransferase 5-like n=1 Tax=Phallusia mammillata TaxID=59560 RepID=A0A6F9DP01_9ASCI|nr:protein arginine N-methyltransferase 5-like [Phallusia mammillata]